MGQALEGNEFGKCFPPGLRVFYKATVQAVLLFGSETWNVTPVLLRSLEGFHVWAACCMTGMMPNKNLSRDWEYPEEHDQDQQDVDFGFGEQQKVAAHDPCDGP